jgi:O-antigen/teichoic acid export membrane protein
MAVLDGRAVTDAAAGAITRGSVTRVGIATVVTALCGYTVLYLAARALEPAGFSVFGVFWGAFGLVTGAAFGLLQESTREVRSALRSGGGAGPPCTHPLRVAAGVGLVAAALIAGSAPLWAGHVFVSSRSLSVLLLSAGLAGFCLHATLLGMLAGASRWTQYGSLMVADAVIRVTIAAAAFVAGWGLVGFLWATVGGAVAWLIMLASSPAARATARVVTACDTATFLRGTAHAVAAAGASAILVMGFPVLLKATSGALGAEGGVVILAVTLTRAPLLVPLTAMQGNLIAHFVDRRAEPLRALAGPAAVVAVIGAAGVAAAGLAGPWLLRTGFGQDYRAGGALLAWLTGAAVAIALLTLTGAAVVAAAQHRAYSLGWVGATIAATLLLLLPLELQTRTVIALLCGPLVGIAVHLVALRLAPATGPPPLPPAD